MGSKNEQCAVNGKRFNFSEKGGRKFMSVALSCLIVLLLGIMGCVTEEKTIVEASPDRSLDPSLIPQVISSYPPANSTGPFSIYTPPFYYCGFECNPCDCDRPAHFTIKFNKVMLVSTLGPASVHCEGFDRPVVISVLRPGDGALSEIQYRISYNASSGVDAMYRVGKSYRITVDTSASDVFGNHLSSLYTLEFVPEPTFRILRTYPASRDTALPSPEVRIQFNSELDSSILKSVSVNPPVSGAWRLSGSDLYFTSLTGFQGGIRYDIVVAAGARDHFNNKLPSLFRTSVNTRSFAISGGRPSNGDTLSDLNQSIGIDFTQELDESSVLGNVRIDPPGDCSLFTNGRMLNLIPITRDFKPSTRYTVTFLPGLKSISGDFLSDTTTYSFSTPPFVVRYVSVSGKSVPRDASIVVRFDARIDTSTVRAGFIMFPSSPGHIVFSDWATSSFTFVPDSIYRPSTKYKVTISKTIKSLGGVSLGKNRNVTFTTSP